VVIALADPPNDGNPAELDAEGVEQHRDDPAWTRLVAQYPDHPSLNDEAIYSLPGKLLDAIVSSAPGILTQADEQFERDLSAAASCGFFQQRRFQYPPLSSHPLTQTPADEIGRKARASAKNIEDMLVDDMRKRGVSDELIFQYFELVSQRNQRIDDWRWSYAGWVVTSSDFQRQLNELRSLPPSRGQRNIPPRLPFTFTGHNSMEDCDEKGHLFLRLWGLESLATWDLPVPMKPQLASPVFYPLPDVSEAGVILFIPWYLLRDKSISLYDLAQSERHLRLPAPLEDWLDAKPQNWGPERFTIMLQIYVYLELGLKRRYRERVSRKLTILDITFAQYFSSLDIRGKPIGEESIRKIRLLMQKRLAAE
jgi:hypothetical protein